MAEITMNTDWGEPGAQLTGAQVQGFIKGRLIELFSLAEEARSGISALSEASNLSVQADGLDEIGAPESGAALVCSIAGADGSPIGRLAVFSNEEGAEVQAAVAYASPADFDSGNIEPSIYFRHRRPGESWSEWSNAVTDQAVPTVLEDELDSMVWDASSFHLRGRERAAAYNVVTRDGHSVGKLLMFTDDMKHVLVQYLVSLFTPECAPGDNAHARNVCAMYRYWSTDGVHGPKRSWSAWRSAWDDGLASHLEKTGAGSVLYDTSIVQSTGNQTDKAMSQKAVVDLVATLCDRLGVRYIINARTGEITFPTASL